MINETYKSMLSGKSVIRELNEYANDITRHPHLKPEDIFDYSLGNLSVPVPEAFKRASRRCWTAATRCSCTGTARVWASPPHAKRSPRLSTAGSACATQWTIFS